MIVSKIIGGLGNQMFQYATARALTLRQSYELSLDISGFDDYKLHNYGLYHFDIIDSIYEKINLKAQFSSSILNQVYNKFSLSRKISCIVEDGLKFNPSILYCKDNVYLDGYWQSEKYFKDFAANIRRDFTYKNPPKELNLLLMNEIDSVESVSVHIRRGDYVSNTQTNSVHGVCDFEYYQSATNYIESKLGKKINYFIFSDDPAWVRANMEFGHDAVYVDHNDASNNFEDMRLMSACKHHIIANSSFSWWGAWLNPNEDKIVIAPKRWFKTTTLDSNDIVPDNWIRL